MSKPGPLGRLGPCAAAWAAVLCLATSCSSGAPTPDWAQDAHAALERATQAYLSAEQRIATAEYERARQQLARTARADLVARGELLRCAAAFASLHNLAATPPSSCAAFEPLRAAASAADQAYADFMAGRLEPARIGLLPEAQQAAAAAGQNPAQREAAIRAIQAPLPRLVAAAAALRDGVAPQGIVDLAVETASAQGWRRPLLAWLTLQLKRAQAAGDVASSQALQQRIELLMFSSASLRSQPAP
jgi:hypothetical protein